MHALVILNFLILKVHVNSIFLSFELNYSCFFLCNDVFAKSPYVSLHTMHLRNKTASYNLVICLFPTLF